VDGQPDILSFGPRRRRGARWPSPGRGRWIAIFVLAVLLACLGVTVSLAVLVAHRDDTINDLRTALRNARHPAPATAAPPAVSGSAMFSLPDAAGGSFSVVAVAVRPEPGSAALTWLFVYGRHANPGERYGLLSDTCGGQYVAAYDLAEGTADRKGDVTIVAPNLDISSTALDVWILVYRLADGTPLGGVLGPLTGNGAKTFRSVPPCRGPRSAASTTGTSKPKAGTSTSPSTAS
jgi:hypothetical protein